MDSEAARRARRAAPLAIALRPQQPLLDSAQAAPAWGRSHWDRLPQELRDIIQDHNTLFGRFLRGDLLRAEVRGMQPKDRQRLWDEAIRRDWRGSLRTLPSISPQSGVFLAIRSRAMLERVRAADVAAPQTVLQVALRNGWTDMLGGGSDDELLAAAALEGSIRIMEDLADGRGVHLTRLHPRMAALGGRLDVVQWLHVRMPSAWWGEDVMRSAAASGSLAVVKWLSEHRSESCTDDALIDAARHGHVDIVRWLLDSDYDEPAEIAAMTAIEHGHLAVAELLCAKPRVKDPQKLLISVAKNGDPKVAEWVCSRFGLRADQWMLELACERDNADLVRWLLQRPNVAINDRVVSKAIRHTALGVLEVAMQADPRWIRSVTSCAARRSDTLFVEWLYHRHPGTLSQRTLEVAARNSSVAVVEFLLAKTDGIAWDVAAARRGAAGPQKSQVEQVCDEFAAQRVGPGLQ